MPLTNADNCCCPEPEASLLMDILNQDRSNFQRLSQLAQAFGGSASGDLSTLTVTCRDSHQNLMAAILAQRQANYDQLANVILAV